MAEEPKTPGNGEDKEEPKEVKMVIVYDPAKLFVIRVESYPVNEIVLQGVFDQAKGFCMADLAQKKFEAMKNMHKSKIIKPGDVAGNPLQRTKDFLRRKH